MATRSRVAAGSTAIRSSAVATAGAPGSAPLSPQHALVRPLTKMALTDSPPAASSSIGTSRTMGVPSTGRM
jgi:hypothetical protein